MNESPLKDSSAASGGLGRVEHEDSPTKVAGSSSKEMKRLATR
jgi:hypothetical protein